MFSAYLNSPPAGANPFALILMAPFTIVGLFVVAIIGWVRLVFAALVVAMSPIWVANLLSAREPRFFYTSLMLLLRLYVIPIMALILMLAIFLLLGSNESFFGGSEDLVSIPRAIIGMVILVVIAIAPIFLAKAVIEKIGTPIKSSIQGALSAADDERAENFLNNTGRDPDGAPAPYGTSARTEGTLGDGGGGYGTGASDGASATMGRDGGLGRAASSDGSAGTIDEGAPAADPVGSLAGGRTPDEQLAEAQRARELGMSTSELREKEEGRKTTAEIESRAALYVERGYDDATALRQAEIDVKGEPVGGGWSKKAFALGAGGTKKILGGMLGDSGVGAAARDSLPGWAQSGLSKTAQLGAGAATLASGAAARLAPLASSAMARHRKGLETAQEARRSWMAAEGGVTAAKARLTAAQSSGDPATIAAASGELKRAERVARGAHRRVVETSQTFSGRMATTRVPMIGAGLRRRDGVTTDANAVRANLERIDTELSRLRADRLIRETSGGARGAAALEKLDAKIAALESQRAGVGSRVASYDSMQEIAGRRRQDAAKAAATRAKSAATRARNIDEIYRRESSQPLPVGGDAAPHQARLAALEERRLEARRTAELAAERAKRLSGG
jgi:hypothetical protein